MATDGGNDARAGTCPLPETPKADNTKDIKRLKLKTHREKLRRTLKLCNHRELVTVRLSQTDQHSIKGNIYNVL